MNILKHSVLMVVVTLVFSQINYSQKVWEKDWQNWNTKEAYKIINDSPWAKNYSNIDVSLFYGNLNKLAFEDNNRLVGAPPIVVRFYSSLKIRQALLRLKQIQEKYDEMNVQQKKEYDEKTSNFLKCDNCKNFYVFILLQPLNEKNAKSVVGESFKDDKLEDLKGKISLTGDNKETRELEQFIAPPTSADPAIFYFPILDEKQKPLITEKTKKVKLNFKVGMMVKNDFLQSVEFDVSKMLINGQLDF